MSAWRVRVVVPARDEEQRLPDCLDALRGAVRRLRRARPTTRVSVTVALDSCVDGSLRIVNATRGVQALTVRHGNVGATRASGVAWATRDDLDPVRVWVACTDADTVVGPDWLLTQLQFAEAGYDAVLGTVMPDPAEAGTVSAAWHAAHDLVEGHGHVHGANLGVALGAYLRAGGFPPAACHEDAALVARLRAAGARLVSTDLTRVRTSARRHGRAPDGFAAYLRNLDAAARGVVA